MSKLPRHVASRSSTAELTGPYLSDLHEGPVRTDARDPASVAVLRLIDRGLASAGLTVKAAARDGIVSLLMVPAACWTILARNAWRAVARNGQEYRDGAQSGSYHGSKWVAWAPTAEPRVNSQEDAAELFAMAITNGAHCAGFTADASWLPTDLVNAADNRLTLPVSIGSDVVAIAQEVCGDSATEAMPDTEAAVLTRRLLRLARRPGQGANDYLRKLRDLVARDLAASPAVTSPSSPRDAPTLDRLHGMDEAVAWGRAVARDLSDYMAGRIPWSAVDRGCLVSGPPGCGKTLFARALSATCGVPLVAGSYGEWQGSGEAHQGSMLKAMKGTFAAARSHPACILFIDEIDSFPNRAAISHRYASYENQVVNALLSEMDGVSVHHGTIFVGACNNPEKLDPALVRSGRLDRHILIGFPDRPALVKILREHLGSDLDGEFLSVPAMETTGLSGADCERLVRGARRKARSAGRAIAMSDLSDEIGGTDDRPPEQQWIAAVHEAGHAVAACLLRPGGLQMVTLRGNEGGGGFTAMANRPSGLVRMVDLRERMVLLLSGRAAEHEVFGVASSGAGGPADSDLARATAILVTASTAFGLDETLGLTWRGIPEPNSVPSALAADPVLADRVRVQLNSAYSAARDLMRLHISAIRAAAAAFVARRVLDAPEIEAIVAGYAGTRT